MLSHINVGCGYEITINDLAEAIRNAVGYQGAIYFDHSKPDGSSRKLMDSARINALDWKPQVE